MSAYRRRVPVEIEQEQGGRTRRREFSFHPVRGLLRSMHRDVRDIRSIYRHLKDLVIAEQFLGSCTEQLKVFLKERGPNLKH